MYFCKLYPKIYVGNMYFNVRPCLSADLEKIYFYSEIIPLFSAGFIFNF